MRKHNKCNLCNKLFFYDAEKEPKYCDSCNMKSSSEKNFKPIPKSSMPKDTPKLGKRLNKDTGEKESISRSDIISH